MDLPAPLEFHALWTPKDGCTDDECEDAFVCDPSAGLAVLADGASQGIFVRRWAKILTRRFPIDRPDVGDGAAVARWLAECRSEWMSGIAYDALHPLAQNRVDRIGAAATLLAVEVRREEDQVHWRASAVGDSCFLWIRDGRVVAFPVERSMDFGIAPDLLSTRSRQVPQVRFVTTEGMGNLGDWYILATDAVTQFLLRCSEEDQAPDWQRFWDMDQECWRHEVQHLREQRRIVNDDSTLLMVRGRP